MKSLLPQAIVLLVYILHVMFATQQKKNAAARDFVFFLPSATHLILFLFFAMRFFAFIFYNEKSSKINKRKNRKYIFIFWIIFKMRIKIKENVFCLSLNLMR